MAKAEIRQKCINLMKCGILFNAHNSRHQLVGLRWFKIVFLKSSERNKQKVEAVTLPETAH